MLNRYLDISTEVKEALEQGKPVVALESTIISHGMPYPQNVETAMNVEKLIRENGAVPATIAIIKGRLKAGLTAMKKPGRGTHGHIAIKTNNVDRAIYHLSNRGVKFDMDSKVVKNGKTTAIYMADEIAGFAIHLVQK